MPSNKIACYFHPSAVAAIDDKPDYLDSLIGKIGGDIYIEPFSDAFKAVEFLKKQGEGGKFLDKHITSLKDLLGIINKIRASEARLSENKVDNLFDIIIVDFNLPFIGFSC